MFENQATFEEKHKQALASIRFLSACDIVKDLPFLMVRTNTSNTQVDTTEPKYSDYDDVDTFIITVSAEIENTIEYKSTANLLNLNVRDGGFF